MFVTSRQSLTFHQRAEIGAAVKRPDTMIGESTVLVSGSAKVWAVADTKLYRMAYSDFQHYADAHPRQACDLLMAMGRVVALRLRRTQARGIR